MPPDATDDGTHIAAHHSIPPSFAHKNTPLATPSRQRHPTIHINHPKPHSSDNSFQQFKKKPKESAVSQRFLKKYQEEEEVHHQKPEVEAPRCAQKKMNSLNPSFLS
jgi:hypothetical protein